VAKIKSRCGEKISAQDGFHAKKAFLQRKASLLISVHGMMNGMAVCIDVSIFHAR
jgi:hypothetical protein